jgi:folate-binding protein YgfZ
MNTEDIEHYRKIRGGGTAYYEQSRGLIEVKGKEAVQFLNGLITNDVAKIEDGGAMGAAFPNAQGRLLAVVRVLRRGEAFLFETEAATREKIHQNLFRFTYAGDFYVEDLSDQYRFFSIANPTYPTSEEGVVELSSAFGADVFVPAERAERFVAQLAEQDAGRITAELYEVLRIEAGIPLYGVEMDETTIVPELGLDDLISYNKGCYIGQEIIARIYFRGHVAKQLRGLVIADGEPVLENLPKAELKTADGKNAGRLTSAVFSPGLGKTIALGFVRYDYLAEGTELKIGEATATVENLPFPDLMS